MIFVDVLHCNTTEKEQISGEIKEMQLKIVLKIAKAGIHSPPDQFLGIIVVYVPDNSTKVWYHQCVAPLLNITLIYFCLTTIL